MPKEGIWVFALGDDSPVALMMEAASAYETSIQGATS